MVNREGIVTRTTISLHESLLDQVRRISQREHVSLGETISELLSWGIRHKEQQRKTKSKPFRLKVYSMGTPTIPLEDKEAIQAAVEKSPK